MQVGNAFPHPTGSLEAARQTKADQGRRRGRGGMHFLAPARRPDGRGPARGASPPGHHYLWAAANQGDSDACDCPARPLSPHLSPSTRATFRPARPAAGRLRSNTFNERCRLAD